jgi:soluble lytic murein transglycosylase
MLGRLMCGVALLSSLGCSADQRGRPLAGFATPLSSPRPSASATAATESSPLLDVESFTPLLSMPALKSAAEAIESGDPSRAAREAEVALAQHTLEGVSAQSSALLLARLQESAGDLPAAIASYEAAAGLPGPLGSYALLGSGRVLLRAGRAVEAKERLARVPQGEPFSDEARLALADASAVTGDLATALPAWREHLAHGDAESDVVPLSLRLADALVARADGASVGDARRAEDAREGLSLARRALAHATDAKAVEQARALEVRALGLLPETERSERARPSSEEELERLRVLEEAKQHDAARVASDQLLAALAPRDRWSKVACEASLLRGRALSGLHLAGDAEALLAEVGKRCDDRDVRARALFLAGKYATGEKRYAEAVRYYEELERECPEHRLADDARLKRAVCYQELGAEARFTELLTRMPDDYPEGDMLLDGMFELATRRMEKGDWAGAAAILERATSAAAPNDAKRGQEFAGRERYFRARALGATGEVDRSLAEYEAIVKELPLSYYMLQAYSRLSGADAARARAALEAGIASTAKAPFSIVRRPEFSSPGFVRALELLRVGDVPSAARELDALGVGRSDAAPAMLWAVALLYERAGSAKLSHAVAQGRLTDWLGRWPAGDWARAWEIVFPRPYHALVQRETKRSGVPESLVYAVMREESSFDPDAESPVKAYGLMQLIEPTARQFGKPLGLHPTAASLKRPAVNVAIGCHLLSELTRSFAENPLLAIPGYNAGAGRPRRWVEERPTLDFDVWVELIPFQETRRYTKRVLSSRAAYAFLYARDQSEDALRLPLQLTRR